MNDESSPIPNESTEQVEQNIDDLQPDEEGHTQDMTEAMDDPLLDQTIEPEAFQAQTIPSQDTPGISTSFASSNIEQMNINLLVDVPLQVTVELGRSRMTVQQVLDLERGSVVELNRAAGDAVDIFINDRLLARGEVVVVDDNFGVRITEIITSTPSGGGG